MNRRTRLGGGAVAVGLAVGLVAALAIPKGQAGAATADGAAGTTPYQGFATAPRIGKPSSRSGNGFSVVHVAPGSLHVELRQADPAGGPDWVVETYLSRRVTEAQYQRRGIPSVSAEHPCALLGREVGGQFGWIDGDDVFHAASPNAPGGTLSDCWSSKLATTHQPELNENALIASPSSTAASVRGSVVWGVVGRPVTSVSLRAAGETTTPRLSSRYGVFVQFYGPDRSAADAELTTQYPTGAAKKRTLSPPGFFMIPPQVKHRERFKAMLPETAVLTARAPDPGGGPSWGLLAARTTAGFWCSYNADHVVGDLVGQVETASGTMYEMDRHGIPCQAPDFKAYPVQLESSYGSLPGRQNLGPAQSTLRLQVGRATFSGLVDPRIDLITIQTPRDIRSVVPTGPAHGFIVVYDGVISGLVRFTLHYRDGTIRHFTENAGL